MTSDTHSQPEQPASEPNESQPPSRQDAPLTPVQLVVRARALQTLENQLNQPRPSLHRRMLTALAVLAVVIALVSMIDFGVRVMHRIMQIWGYETMPAPPPEPLKPGQPFFITVDPPAPDAQSSSSAGRR